MSSKPVSCGPPNAQTSACNGSTPRSRVVAARKSACLRYIRADSTPGVIRAGRLCLHSPAHHGQPRPGLAHQIDILGQGALAQMNLRLPPVGLIEDGLGGGLAA